MGALLVVSSTINRWSSVSLVSSVDTSIAGRCHDPSLVRLTTPRSSDGYTAETHSFNLFYPFALLTVVLFHVPVHGHVGRCISGTGTRVAFCLKTTTAATVDSVAAVVWQRRWDCDCASSECIIWCMSCRCAICVASNLPVMSGVCCGRRRHCDCFDGRPQRTGWTRAPSQ
jgi:hypothetical protein